MLRLVPIAEHTLKVLTIFSHHKSLKHSPFVRSGRGLASRHSGLSDGVVSTVCSSAATPGAHWGRRSVQRYMQVATKLQQLGEIGSLNVTPIARGTMHTAAVRRARQAFVCRDGESAATGIADRSAWSKDGAFAWSSPSIPLS